MTPHIIQELGDTRRNRRTTPQGWALAIGAGAFLGWLANAAPVYCGIIIALCVAFVLGGDAISKRGR